MPVRSAGVGERVGGGWGGEGEGEGKGGEGGEGEAIGMSIFEPQIPVPMRVPGRAYDGKKPWFCYER